MDRYNTVDNDASQHHTEIKITYNNAVATPDALVFTLLILNPVDGGTARITSKDAVLSDYHVSAGTLAAVPFHELFTIERYHEEPFKFIPERWINKENYFDPYSFVLFEFGPQGCIGKRLAELEITLFVTEKQQLYMFL
ncbi:hypothetical protein NPIL_406781 [Nephila pilipes]|uniref:Cytochrome P450 n=1 Tax=Nephila pilipes TaxID=299642 RepID=A0A8X6QEJ2_NEPPI|nr:hypothetical protein NPIL_406781 [Nephila pilipes]